MFSHTNDNGEANKTTRRAFLSSAAIIAAGLYFWSMRKSHPAEAGHAGHPAGHHDGPPEEVTIVEFTDSGERKATVHVAKIVKTEAEWRQQLDSNAFDITRHEDTEMAFSGKYWNEHSKGLYRCICCDTALFNSDTKFESGTGWPSFWQPIAAEPRRILRSLKTAVLACCARVLPAAAATPIWATFLKMVPGPRACVIA